jgi:predicted ATPase
MGVFLATAVSAGLQIILETHSDHILNGIRKAVKQQVISPEDALIHFFAPRPEESDDKAAQIVSPLIDQNGNLDYWPPNFFDQFDRDMSDLIDLGE